jgi:hypothetical protein
MGITRATRIYFFHIMWIAISISSLLNNGAANSRLPFMPYVWIVIGTFFTISLVSILLKKYYLEVNENKLLIHGDLFQTKTINLDEIEKMVSRRGLMTGAYFLLKNQTKVKFNEGYLNHTDLREFTKQHNIAVD